MSASLNARISRKAPNIVRILGIDPGLRNTGWGVIETDGVRLTYIACGTIHSDAKRALSDRLMQIHVGLNDILDIWTPDEAAVEETFVNKSGASSLKLGQARGIAMVVPALYGLDVAEYAPTKVKKTVVGAGRAGKAQIGAMIGYLLPKAKPSSEDAADALAIAITHAHNRTLTSLLSA